MVAFDAMAASTVVPLNGRIQHMVFASTPVRDLAADAYHQKLRQLASEGQLDTVPAQIARVRRITEDLISQAVRLNPEASDWSWQIHVAGNHSTDAYCMAGGKILVGETFLEDGRFSDPELAALLGHEIAHAIAGHVREELSAVPGLDPGYARFSLEDVVAVLKWDLSVTLKLTTLSRLHELEADDIGITLAAMAGYDPRASLEFFRKLGRLDDGADFFSSHPARDERLRVVENLAAYAVPLFRSSQASQVGPMVALH